MNRRKFFGLLSGAAIAAVAKPQVTITEPVTPPTWTKLPDLGLFMEDRLRAMRDQSRKKFFRIVMEDTGWKEPYDTLPKH